MTSHGVPRLSDQSPRSEQSKQRELQRVHEYKNLVRLVNSEIQEQHYTPEVLQLTSKLLNLNPEYYTIWNHRRRVLQQLFTLPSAPAYPPERTSKLSAGPNHGRIFDLINTDLIFVSSLLRKFPKCYWIWNHRRWLLQEASLSLSAPVTRDLWTGELALVGKMLSLDNRNFHGWAYRRTAVESLEGKKLASEGASVDMTKEEFAYTTRMISTSMSNFSAWHRRSKLIPRLLNNRGAADTERRKMLDDELNWIQEGLYTDSRDQSLWFYYHNLICTFDPSIAAQSMAPNLSPDERLDYLLSEMNKLIEMLEDDDNSKWQYQSLIDIAMLYKASSGRLPTRAENVDNWMASLKKLDPLRKGRWADLGESIHTQQFITTDGKMECILSPKMALTATNVGWALQPN